MNEVKILLVEDEPSYAELLQNLLTESFAIPFEWTHALQLREALQVLKTQSFDVVLLDLSLPDSQGLNTYLGIKLNAPGVPVIVLTGNDDQQLALQAVREGAQDYLVKGQTDGRILARAIRYAIERKRAEEALRQSEQFFRLISENVTDLIAVLDAQGRRLYNSPSYRNLLGEPRLLLGTDSFEEIHPDDRARIKQLFQETVATGEGRRTEYRMVLKDGSVRHIESQGSVIRDAAGRPCKIVVVSRDITERRQAVETLRQALSDLNQSHEELKATQARLIQAEKLEAVSTFAAGVAHEVKNPLQTLILGVDYLSHHLQPNDANRAMVLEDMGDAVRRADALIRGLMEFSSYRKSQVQAGNLSAIMEEALQALQNELASHPIRLVKDLAANLPPLPLDTRTIKHVFIHLLLYCLANMTAGGQLVVRTFVRPWTESGPSQSQGLKLFQSGDTIVAAEVEDMGFQPAEPKAEGQLCPDETAKAPAKINGLGLTVLNKIVELYGGLIEVINLPTGGNKYSVLFRAQE